jgi:hypothetical protein
VRFAFHPGEVQKPHAASFTIYLSGTLIDLLEEELVDLDARRWQIVSLPLTAFGAGRQDIIEVSFAGNFGGTFYIDDLRIQGPSQATAIADDGPPRQPSSWHRTIPIRSTATPQSASRWLTQARRV